MKILFVLLFLCSCIYDEQKSEVTQGADTLYKYQDRANRVTCYRISGVAGVSCLKD